MSTPTGGNHHKRHDDHHHHEEHETHHRPSLVYHGTLLTEFWEAGHHPAAPDCPPTGHPHDNESNIRESTNNDGLRSHFQSTQQTELGTRQSSPKGPEASPAPTISAGGDYTSNRAISMYFYEETNHSGGRSRDKELSIMAATGDGTLSGSGSLSLAHQTSQPVSPPVPSVSAPVDIDWSHGSTITLSDHTKISFIDVSSMEHKAFLPR